MKIVTKLLPLTNEMVAISKRIADKLVSRDLLVYKMPYIDSIYGLLLFRGLYFKDDDYLVVQIFPIYNRRDTTDEANFGNGGCIVGGTLTKQWSGEPGGILSGGNANYGTIVNTKGGILGGGRLYTQVSFQSKGGAISGGSRLVGSTFHGTGGSISGGNVTATRLEMFEGTGGVLLGGEGFFNNKVSFLGIGGCISGGSFSTTSLELYRGKGGILLGGESVFQNKHNFNTKGGVLLGGNTYSQFIYSSSGGILAGGDATITNTTLLYGTGGIISGGNRTTSQKSNYSGIGGVLAGGNFSTTSFEIYRGKGGLLAGGDLTYGILDSLRSGGVITGGDATFTNKIEFNTQGGSLSGGKATVTKFDNTRIAPTIIWPTDETIWYGQTNQVFYDRVHALNEGTFTWSEPGTTLHNAQENIALTYSYVPNDLVRYYPIPMYGEITGGFFTVKQTVPLMEFNSLSIPAIYDETLSTINQADIITRVYNPYNSVQLFNNQATTGNIGILTYTVDIGGIATPIDLLWLDVGEYQLSATWLPEDEITSNNYTSVTKAVLLKITEELPMSYTIINNTAIAISGGLPDTGGEYTYEFQYSDGTTVDNGSIVNVGVNYIGGVFYSIVKTNPLLDWCYKYPAGIIFFDRHQHNIFIPFSSSLGPPVCALNEYPIVWPADMSITYGEALSVFYARVEALNVGAGTFVWHTERTLTPNATVTPTYAINYSFYPTSTSYDKTIDDGIWITVNKAVLTVTPDDKTRAYMQNNPTFTYKITGFKLSDTAASIGLTNITLFTLALPQSDVPLITEPTYKIYVNNTVGDYTKTFTNYTLAQGIGVLTITKAAQTTLVTITTPSSTRMGNTFYASASGGNGTGPYIYRTDTPTYFYIADPVNGNGRVECINYNVNGANVWNGIPATVNVTKGSDRNYEASNKVVSSNIVCYLGWVITCTHPTATRWVLTPTNWGIPITWTWTGNTGLFMTPVGTTLQIDRVAPTACIDFFTLTSTANANFRTVYYPQQGCVSFPQECTGGITPPPPSVGWWVGSWKWTYSGFDQGYEIWTIGQTTNNVYKEEWAWNFTTSRYDYFKTTFTSYVIDGNSIQVYSGTQKLFGLDADVNHTLVTQYDWIYAIRTGPFYKQ